MALQWEHVEAVCLSKWGSIVPPLHRARVPGGWLVGFNTGSGGGLTFVPDPGHQWEP